MNAEKNREAGRLNKEFLDSQNDYVRSDILQHIAERHGSTKEESLSEITGEDAKNLLSYLAEPKKTAVAIVMQRNGLI